MTHTDRPERPAAPPPPHPDMAQTDTPSGRAAGADQRPDDRPPGAASASRRVSPALARQIDENLKRLYQSRVEEDLPPQLRALVAQLRDSGNGTSGGSTSGGNA